MGAYLGWVALLLFITGGLFREPRKSMYVAICGNLLFFTSYLLSSSYAPAINLGCTTACVLAMLVIDKKHLQKCMFISMAIATAGILTTFSSSYDFLIIAAGCIIAFSNYNRDNYIIYKLAVMGSQFLWIIYTVQFGDYPMLATCLMIIFSNTISLTHNLHKDGYMTAFYMMLKGMKARPAMIMVRTKTNHISPRH
jgi:hypothetical protein